MIENKSFTKEWLDVFRAKKEHKGINVTILEKMVHAFSLLEHLKIEGLDFVFKGGTSLVLLLEEGNRFSIDIDIISSVKRDPLKKILDAVVANSHFKSHILNERRSYKEGVPKAHYTFEFDSVYNPNVPGTILLDILFDSPHYPELIESSIEVSWLSVAGTTTTITTPSVNSICGDKLTAFAPETIGIPYYKGDQLFAMEICKQFNYYVTKCLDNGDYMVKEATMSKLQSTKMADDVIYQCLQFLGGYGYMEEYPLARMARDSRLGPIGGGTSEILREIIAKMVIDNKDYKPAT